MIRRDMHDADDGPAWLLITQRQHARLAADLADAWNLAGVPEGLRSELLWTIAHHDDGWTDWDQQPGLDADGRPLSFLEMPIDQATSIWTRSIKLAADHSPLSGHLVSQHFLQLRSSSTAADQPAARQFANTFQPFSEGWLQQARRIGGPGLSRDVILSAQQYLQLFDVLSLTLCCGPLARLPELNAPAGGRLNCRQLSAWHWSLWPWWLNPTVLRLHLQAEQLEARPYRDAQQLKQAMRPRPLQWTLTAAQE